MSVIDEIKERLDIVEVISGYVPLKKAGRNYQGLCPFHSEKTPSFVVFQDTQSWHCFGACGTGGDIFTFVQKRENLDFSEALKMLADRAGVELQAHEGPQPAAERHLERLREVITNSAGYYHHLLLNAGEASIARDYLARRGFLPETWAEWQLGYALDSWDALKDQLGRSGYTLEELADAGMVIQREDGSGYYDRFRGRLMIPIRDAQGRAIGFGARQLREDPSRPQPKYINSPQTALFDKSSVLFGLDRARQAIREADLAVLVEGYMDVLMSHQVGVRHVVAGMGTALTEHQLRQMKRYSRNITLALDPDAAGLHAALRGLQTAREALDREWEPVVDPRGLVRQESRLRAQLRIAALPDGLDPDELARADRERWLRVIADAQPTVDYYLDVVSREEDLATAHGKANLVARMAPLVREVANPIERNHYIQRVARLVQTDERLVAEEVLAAGDEGVRSGTVRRRPANPDSEDSQVAERGVAYRGGKSPGGLNAERKAFGLEEHILGHLLLRPDLLARLDSELIALTNTPLMPDDFTAGENQALLAAMRAAGPSAGLDEVMDRVAEPLHDGFLSLTQRIKRGPGLSDEKLIKELGDAVLRLRERNLNQRMRRLEFLILDDQSAGTGEQLHDYMSLMLTYVAQERRIQKLLHSRTMIGSISKDNGTL
jgi:DNA primase